MRKLAGVVAMSVMLLLAACGGGQSLTTKTYTYLDNGKTITIPASVANLVLLSGQGAPGAPESEYYVEQYSKTTTTYNQRNDQGGTINSLDGGTTYHYGSTPSDYCTSPTPYVTNGVTNYTWTCYAFSDTSYTDYNPATTGENTSMTGPNGFTRTWAGGVGGPPAPISESNVAVVPSGQYVLSIPYGGSITLSYYQ